MKYFIFIVVFFISANLQSQKTIENKKRISFKCEDPGNTALQFYNNDTSKIYFTFSINNKLYFTINDYTNKIVEDYGENNTMSLEEFSWNVIISDIQHQLPYTEKQWGHHALLLLNSFGFGYCDDAACATSIVWNRLGMNSRVADMKTHVVPEVKSDNTWKMYDTDMEIYFSDSLNNVVSADTVIKYSGTNKIKPNPSGFLRFINRKKNNTVLYSSKNKTYFNKNWIDFSQKSDSFYILLPPGAKFTLPQYCHSMKKDYPYSAFATITINKGFSGSIPNSLALCGIEGKGNIRINGTEYSLPKDKDKIRIVLKTSENYIYQTDILNIKDSIRLVYFINPNYSNLKEKNTIDIYALGNEFPKMKRIIIEGNNNCKPFIADTYNSLVDNMIETSKVIETSFSEEIKTVNNWDEISDVLLKITDEVDDGLKEERLIKQRLEILEEKISDGAEEKLWLGISDPEILAMLYVIITNSKENDFNDFIKFLQARLSDI